MSLLNFFNHNDINQGVEEFSNTKGAVLIDVREKNEFVEGHIPRSKNIPLSSIKSISTKIQEKNTPLFVYCLSGSRSTQATKLIQSLGYTNVKNIGGISSYTGKVER